MCQGDKRQALGDLEERVLIPYQCLESSASAQARGEGGTAGGSGFQAKYAAASGNKGMG